MDALQVVATAAGAALTPAQKRFNALLRQIEQARAALASWHEGVAAYRTAHVKVLEPLRAQLLAGHRQWVMALDAALDQRPWTGAEHETLRELICEAAGELLEAQGDDPELQAVFARHAEVDFETGQRQRMLASKDLAEALTGLDLGDEEGIGSEEDLFMRLQQRIQQEVEAEEAEREAQAASRRKSAVQRRREAEAQQATQSVREVYRKLASALHPDREADDRQREIKTALMQRANQAYEAQDLLTLLELQLQIEQIDANTLGRAGDKRLKHYNKVLAEQLDELKAEIQQVEMAFRMDFGLAPGWGLNPRKLGGVLEEMRQQWRAELEHQQRQLRMLSDAAATKRWLKRWRKRRRELDAEDDLIPF